MSAVKMAAGGIGAFLGSALLGVVLVTGQEVKRGGTDLVSLGLTVDSLREQLARKSIDRAQAATRPSVSTEFNPAALKPSADPTAFLDPLASVIGDVKIGKQVYVAPFASIRGDEGHPIFIGEGTNIQDGVVIHALETMHEGKPIPNRTFDVGGKAFAVHIGNYVSIAHQALVHGPARIGDSVFVGMQAMVFKSIIGAGSVVEPGAKVIGVTVAPGHYVPAGTTVVDQSMADKLPAIAEGYGYKGLNDAVVRVNEAFAAGYAKAAEAKAEEAKKAQTKGNLDSKPGKEDKEKAGGEKVKSGKAAEESKSKAKKSA